ncbi:MAG TPA: hypothetical protein DCY13_11545 [Verrucomicrobiales bacterium]|nr:hypothetical protein [Verrucomicrobiales bacterium]
MNIRLAALIGLIHAGYLSAGQNLETARYLPMEGAPRAIYLRLAESLHLAFDTELLRTHLAWSGEGLQLNGTPHTGSKTPFLCRPIGQPIFTSLPASAWHVGDVMPDLAGGRSDDLEFLAMKSVGGRAVFRYQVGRGRQATVIEETPLALPGFPQGLGRQFEIGPSTETLWLQLLAGSAATEEILHFDQDAVAFRDDRGWVMIWAGVRPEGSNWTNTVTTTGFTHTIESESGGESVPEKVRRDGPIVRSLLSIPPREQTVRCQILMTRVPSLPPDLSAAIRELKTAVATELGRAPAITPPTTAYQVSANGRRQRGDESYAVESLPLPPEVELKVTGMAWFTDETLAISTWTGEIWLLENARDEIGKNRFRKFAGGLNEPLGLAVIDGDIVVAQKPELTRIKDLDGDGVADSFECLNDDWHFTGNYHAFTFGPALAHDGSFLLGFCGQRARWDVDYAGWIVRIGADGRGISPVASGLRAPNGIGHYGPDGDLFATDNQGNWIGACKLNHIQAGLTYGYRSALPAPEIAWEQPPANFTPPAVWFPRKLAPSAAGFVTIPAEGFGPFGRQMLVADFQNAVVLRVALENVNGRWQGAVFPFLKGFGSGANRLIFDPEGRLYVGGVKNKAWSSVGPFEQSLDRVAFTGVAPFEVLQARAMEDGLELIFTAPVSREFAGDSDSYFVSQFRYAHHETYGSPEFDHAGTPGSATPIEITGVTVSEDARRVRLNLPGLKTRYVTRVVASGVESVTGELLRSEELYYTLNELPQ